MYKKNYLPLIAIAPPFPWASCHGRGFVGRRLGLGGYYQRPGFALLLCGGMNAAIFVAGLLHVDH